MAPSEKQNLNLTAAISVIAGSIIGAGVFMKVSDMAEQVASPLWLTFTWIIAGVFSFFGALIFAELGTMLPQSGGLFIYFEKLFGKCTAFLYGWSAFAVINTAAVAAMAYVCALYANYFINFRELSQTFINNHTLRLSYIGTFYPFDHFYVKLLAVVIVIFLTLVNYLSLRAGSWLQVISTAVKLIAILVLFFGIFFSGKGHFQNFYISNSPKHGVNLLNGFVAALTGAFFAFDGWINIVSMASDIQKPQKNIPKALFIGVAICMVIYVLLNQSYLYVMPVEKISHSKLVAADAMGIAWGKTSEGLISAMIVFCTFGAINGNIMATARITYAMGNKGVFAKWVGNTHKKFKTPGNALLLHGCWTSILIFSSSFDTLADMFVFITWLAYAFGAIGVFLFRKKLPNLHRPYKIWYHPYITIAFILFSFFYLTITVYNDVDNYLHHRQPVVNSLLGLLITLSGIPIFYYYQFKYKSK